MSSTVPDFINPIVGYRFWWHFNTAASGTYNPDGLLHSLNWQHHVWPVDQPMVAEPTQWGYSWQRNWSGGIYAFKTYDRLKLESSGIFGEVWLWGRIEEHAEGWRAEFAYPKRLYSDRKLGGSCRGDRVIELARRYGIATEEQSRWTLESMFARFMPNRWRQHRQERLSQHPHRKWSNQPPLGSGNQPHHLNSSPWALKQQELELGEFNRSAELKRLFDGL